MAMTVKDIMDLPSVQKMELLAGKGGLNRPVVSAEIADYEFASNVEFLPEAEFDPQTSMEPGSFVITSFLFAKDDPSLILPMVRQIAEMGTSALAYKRIIYDELPAEVLAFAEEKKFPIFSFGRTVWFENIIFDIMYAVQFDDKVYLSEEKISAMLASRMSRSEVDIILKGISLKLRKYISVSYLICPADRTDQGAGPDASALGSLQSDASAVGSLQSDASAQGSLRSDASALGSLRSDASAFDVGRVLRSFYLMKGYREKALLVRFENGIFLITTSNHADLTSHRLIVEEAIGLFGIPADTIIGMSSVHFQSELDEAFRESSLATRAAVAEHAYQTSAHASSFPSTASRGKSSDASSASSQTPQIYTLEDAGVYRLILPVLEHTQARAYADSILSPLADYKDLRETAECFVSAGGDLAQTADLLHCHVNTIRYRLGRIRELTGLAALTDSDFYVHLKLAISIACARNVAL